MTKKDKYRESKVITVIVFFLGLAVACACFVIKIVQDALVQAYPQLHIDKTIHETNLCKIDETIPLKQSYKMQCEIGKTNASLVNCNVSHRELYEYYIDKIVLKEIYSDEIPDCAYDERDYRIDKSTGSIVFALDDGLSAQENELNSLRDYSETNIQEIGVDEEDFIKNDGDYIYAIRGDKVGIFKSWPPQELTQVAEIQPIPINYLQDQKYRKQNKMDLAQFSDGDSYYHPNSLFLLNKKLIIIDYQSDYNIRNHRYYINRDNNLFNDEIAFQNKGIVIRVFDVSNPAAPKFIHKKHMNGRLVSARLVNNSLHLVLSHPASSIGRAFYSHKIHGDEESYVENGYTEITTHNYIHSVGYTPTEDTACFLPDLTKHDGFKHDAQIDEANDDQIEEMDDGASEKMDRSWKMPIKSFIHFEKMFFVHEHRCIKPTAPNADCENIKSQDFIKFPCQNYFNELSEYYRCEIQNHSCSINKYNDAFEDEEISCKNISKDDVTKFCDSDQPTDNDDFIESWKYERCRKIKRECSTIFDGFSECHDFFYHLNKLNHKITYHQCINRILKHPNPPNAVSKRLRKQIGYTFNLTLPFCNNDDCHFLMPAIPNHDLPNDSLSVKKEIIGSQETEAIMLNDQDIQPKPNDLITIVDLNGDNFDQVQTQGIWLYPSKNRVYVSADNLYLATSSYGTSKDDTDTYDDYHYTSTVHRFKLDDGHSQYVGSVDLEGQIGDSFWMSEYDHHLRIVTEKHNRSMLSVVSLDGRDMKVVGSLDDLGKSEHVYAVRMFDDKGFVVTFRDTDPLYTLDLSNPGDPQTIGELQIPGYSTYIHPMDETHLLTIGKDDNRDDSNVHLQIFDVSDFSSPKRLFHEVLEDIHNSSALTEHHNFQYHRASGLLAIETKNDIQYDEKNKEILSLLTTEYFLYRASIDNGIEFLGTVKPIHYIRKSQFINKYYDLYHRSWINSEKEYILKQYTNHKRALFYFKDHRDYFKDAYVYTFTPDIIQINDANHPDKLIKKIIDDKN